MASYLMFGTYSPQALMATIVISAFTGGFAMNSTAMAVTTQEQEAERKVLLENAEVVVIETTYPPNTGVAMHEHRYPHVVYVVNGGTVQISAPGGRVSTLELHSGQTLWRNAQSHSTRNIGSTTYKVLEIEIKRAAR